MYNQYRCPPPTRKRTHLKPEATLPIPNVDSHLYNWTCFKGEFNGECITVREPRDVYTLNSMGCYGTQDIPCEEQINECEHTLNQFRIEELSSKILQLGNRNALHCDAVILKNKLPVSQSEEELTGVDHSETTSRDACNVATITSNTVLSSEGSSRPAQMEPAQSGQVMHKNDVEWDHVPAASDDWRVLEDDEADPWAMDEEESANVSLSTNTNASRNDILHKEHEVPHANVHRTQPADHQEITPPRLETICDEGEDGGGEVDTRDINEETTEDITKETAEEIARETTEDITKETAEEIARETTEDITKETAEGVLEGTTEGVMEGTTNQQCCKINQPHPPPIRQQFELRDDLPLLLTSEETFFLSYALGCLVLRDARCNKLLDLLAMWRLFVSLEMYFIPKYVVYHNFRSRGWVVRDGVKFGVHYTLYKDGPAFYHASYSVVIRAVREKSPGHYIADTRFHEHDMKWPMMLGCERVIKSTRKEMLLCYVIFPDDIDLQSPTCINVIKIQEVVAKRCVLSDEREEREINML